MSKKYSKTITDVFGDGITATVRGDHVVAHAVISSGLGGDSARMVYTAGQARKLAKALRAAADVAEGKPAKAPKPSAPQHRDRVRILVPWDGFDAGVEGTVDMIDSDGDVWVFTDNGDHNRHAPSSVEVIS